MALGSMSDQGLVTWEKNPLLWPWKIPPGFNCPRAMAFSILGAVTYSKTYLALQLCTYTHNTAEAQVS